MARLYCPKCGIHRFAVRNDQGESIVVEVDRQYNIEPVNPDDSLDGFNLNVLYCLGCSWKGSVEELKKIPS